jgi:hypothetical protein
MAVTLGATALIAYLLCAIAMAAITVLYAGLQFGAQGVLGPALATSSRAARGGRSRGAWRMGETQRAIVVVLAITSTFERLAILANLSILVLYGMCCLATWQLRRRDMRAGGTPFRVPAPTLVIVLACLVIGWVLTSVTLAPNGPRS